MTNKKKPSLTTDTNRYKSKSVLRKSLARLVAVQILYAHDTHSQNAEKVLGLLPYYDEPANYTDLIGYQPDIIPDKKFLINLISKTIKQLEQLDKIIQDHLAENWDMTKLSLVLKAILRVAVCELNVMADTPVKVIINEYTTLARSFYGDNETSFVNSILDKIALGREHTTRP